MEVKSFTSVGIFNQSKTNMPNYCQNEWRIMCNSTELFEEVKATLFDKEGHLDFNILVPMPKPLFNTATGHRFFDGTPCRNWYVGNGEERPFTAEEEKELTEIGHFNQIDWAIANWGTKWNACDPITEFHANPIYPNAHEILITFDTAWGPPEEFFDAFKKKFRGIDISAFYREDGVQIAGYL